MSKFSGFLSKNNNKFVKVLPNTLPPQCFDVITAWTDYIGIPHFPSNPSPFPYANAYQIYTDFSSWQSQYFDRIANGPLNSPQEGDIVVWKPGYNGGAGHTGVATGNSGLWSFECFEQNDPVGSKAHVQSYGYGYLQNSGIYGWLRPKKQYLVQSDAEILQLIKDTINTSITDTRFRQWERELLGV